MIGRVIRALDPVSIFKAYDIRGLYGDEIDGDVAERSAAPSRACSATWPASPTSELRVGLGRDMRLTAPGAGGALPRGHGRRGRARDRRRDGRHRDALLARRLARARRRPDVHRLAQPEGLHGREARRARRDRAVRRRAASRTSAATIEAGLGERARAAARARRSTSTTSSSAAALKFIDPDDGQAAEGRRRRRQRHGRARWSARCSSSSGSTSSTTYWAPDGEFPDHEPNPLLPENREFIIDKVVAEGADLGIAWDGDADRCFFIDDTGRFVDGDFLTALLAESLLEKQPGRDDPLRRARLARGAPTPSSGSAAPRSSTASATPSSRRACATRARSSAARSPATTTSATSTARTRGTIPALLILELLSHADGKRSASCSSRCARRYFISGEINSEVADAAGRRWPRSRSATRDGEHHARSTASRRLRRLALQRAPVEHRAAAAAVPRESLVSQRGHGAPARRGARADPRVSAAAGTPTARSTRRERASTACRSRRRSPWGASTLPDRGRPADARRLRAELRQGARRARARRCARAATASRTSS